MKFSKKKWFNKNVLFLASLTIVATPVFIYGVVNKIESNKNEIKLVSSTKHAEADQSIFDKLTVETLTFDIKQDPTWKGTKTADQITPTELTQILIPKLNGGIYFVTIIPPTEDEILNGELRFLVTQNKPKFEKGAPSSNIEVTRIEPNKKEDGKNPPMDIEMRAYPDNKSPSAPPAGAAPPPPPAAPEPVAAQTENEIDVFGQKIEKKYVWTTKNISGLIRAKKFSFKWNTDEEIGAFLRTTSKTAETLSDADVISNFVSTADRDDFLPDETKATITTNDLSLTYNISEDDAKRYGIAKVKIDFGSSKGATESNWIYGSKPKDSDITKIVRGLANSSGEKEVVKLNTETFRNSTYDLAKILRTNPVFSAPASVLSRLNDVPTNSSMKEDTYTFTLNELTPTQIINAVPNDSLLNFLSSKTYLKKEEKTPPIFIQYMNKDAFNSTLSQPSNNTQGVPFFGTGLDQIKNVPVYANENSTSPIDRTTNGNVASDLNIRSIRAVGNDLTGNLDLEVKYTYYDVFDNKLILDKTALIQLTGFATNPDFGKNLFFNWKQDADLTYNSANFFMQQYETHKDNEKYLKELTNEFFYATPAVYEKDRKVTVQSMNNNQIKITLEFEQFGGSFYVENNKVHAGLKVEKTFNLTNNHQVGTQIRFKSEEELKEQIPNYDQLSPSKLINLIAEKQLTDNNFFNPISSNEYTFHTLYQPISTNDGIKVTVAGVHNSDPKQNLYFTNYYFGLVAEAPTSTIFNLNFNENLVQNDEYRRLLRTPLQDVTVEDITNLYLKNLSLFKDFGATFTLDPSQVKITKDENAGTIKVDLTLNRFNTNAQTEGVNNQTTYSTILKGFISQNLIDANSKTAPVDLTIPLAAGLGVAVSVSLLAAALWSVYKRVELTKKSKIKI